MPPTTTPNTLPTIKNHFVLSTAMATSGTTRLSASAALRAEASTPAARPNIEIRPPRTKPPASQRWYLCVIRSVSRGTSTGLRTWRVDTQRFTTLKNCTVFRLETMSPTPTEAGDGHDEE